MSGGGTRTQSVDTDAAALNFGEEFKQAHALLNAEVLLLLEGYEKNRQAGTYGIPYSGPNPYQSHRSRSFLTE